MKILNLWLIVYESHKNKKKNSGPENQSGPSPNLKFWDIRSRSFHN